MNSLIITSAAGLLLALTSCTNYQYVQLESNLERDPGHNRFYYNDEGLYLDFNFWSSDGSTTIYVRNEGELDIYYDLEKTLFMKNDGILRNGAPESAVRFDGTVHGNSASRIRIPPGRYLSITYRVFALPYNKVWKQRAVREKHEMDGLTYVTRKYDFDSSEPHRLEVLLHFYVDAEEPYTREIRGEFNPTYALFTTLSPEYFKGGGPTATYAVDYGNQALLIDAAVITGLTIVATSLDK